MEPGDPRLRQSNKDTSECSTTGDDKEESISDMEQGSSSCVAGGVSPASCCLICLEVWREGEMICQSAGCSHIFHQSCIVSWLVHHRDCPACRQAFLPASSQDEEEEEAEEHYAWFLCSFSRDFVSFCICLNIIHFACFLLVPGPSSRLNFFTNQEGNLVEL